MAQAQTKADKAPEIDLDAEKPATNKKHLVLYIVIGVLVIGLGVTVALLLLKDKGETPAAEGGTEAAPVEVEAKPAAYLAFKPFVVNFAQKGPARFLQVEVQVMAADPAVLAAVELHMPAIRNDINMLLAGQTFETASTREGKEALREEIKKIIQKVLDAQKVTGAVEAVYFTSFVMQ